MKHYNFYLEWLILYLDIQAIIGQDWLSTNGYVINKQVLLPQ